VLYEADDGRADGYSHREFAQAIATSVQRNPLCLSLPAPALHLGARLDRWWRGDKAKLTPDRAAYFCHPDWAADPAKAPPADLWRPQVAVEDGMARTAAWYQAQGWL
jgi:nucleoside-diphosphate-sugar epimerase